MQALVLEAKGEPPKYMAVEAPTPGPAEARVRVHAAALNHRDVWIRGGAYPGFRVPIILGSDGCGVVDACPADPLRIGERVIICPSLFWGDDPRHQGPGFQILGLPRDGTFAEQVVVPIESLVPWPSHMSAPQAAALPLAGLTAWRALMTRAALQPGDRVLITGIGGGVALAALQIAVHQGARVAVTSSSPGKLARAVELGAVGGELYTDDGWARAIKKRFGPEGFDVIVDSAGGAAFAALPKLLAMSGRVVFFGGTTGAWQGVVPAHLFYKQATVLGSTMGSPAEFRAMVEFYARHQLQPVVDRVFPLAEGAAAFARMAAGGQFGKLVLTV